MRLPSYDCASAETGRVDVAQIRSGITRQRAHRGHTMLMITASEASLLPSVTMTSGDKERYSRQILFPEIGERGQEALSVSHAVIVGCGALGSLHAIALARAGVGRITIIDRDYVEQSNLQRQFLFEESDAADALPKAVAAARHLERINSRIDVRGVVADLNPTNAEELLTDAGVILDGTDNFET